MTLEELRQYQAIKESIKAIEAEIESLYYPISSPPMVSDGSGRSLSPSDPTARAFYRIEADRERLARKQEELTAQKERIDIWIDNLDDQHIAAIIRWHFLLGKTWRETCIKIYGYPDPDICRVAVKRYFEKESCPD